MGTLHVVGLSGGKDSTAMALRLTELEPETDFTYLCTPTGDELPELVAHWRWLGERLGQPLLPVTGGRSLSGLIRAQRALPNWRMRWCTRMLKIEPTLAWMTRQLEAGYTIVSYVGLRADEPERMGLDYAAHPGVTQRFPLREWGWGLAEVRAYLEAHGVRIPERTDCARCFFQTLGEWWVLWREHRDLYLDAEAQEALTGYTFRSPQRDSWPTALTDLRAEFERGRIPPRTALQPDLFRRTQCRACSL